MTTRTHTTVTFANPYLTCDQCGRPVTGWHNNEACGCDAACWNVPCGHTAGATVCPSWSPAAGCTCAEVLGSVGHTAPTKRPRDR